jgi:Ca2+-binding EF-hand superfamily protein
MAPASRVPGSSLGPAAGGLPFYLRQPGDPPGALPAQLLARYGRKGDTLGRDELRLDKSAFDRLDRNKDGRLDAAELAGWASLPPDLTVLVEMGPGARAPLTVLSRAPGLDAHRLPGGPLVLVLGDWQLELGLGQGHRSPAARRSSRAAALQTFRSFDRNRDGYLDDSEVAYPAVTMVALLRLADRNGDGKISEKEFLDFAEWRDRLNAQTTFFVLEDRGRRLFAHFDLDGDGRLSQRELKTAWARARPWGLDRTGALRPDRVPHQYRITLSHGYLQPLGRSSAGFAPPVVVPGALPPLERRGPLWFRKMDRNRDGDVSRREFLGTDEQFRRIDANGDGLIDVEEAERADAWFRKQLKR